MAYPPPPLLFSRLFSKLKFCSKLRAVEYRQGRSVGRVSGRSVKTAVYRPVGYINNPRNSTSDSTAGREMAEHRRPCCVAVELYEAIAKGSKIISLLFLRSRITWCFLAKALSLSLSLWDKKWKALDTYLPWGSSNT
ncbi:uncharacterized protein CIMG_13717 [Coccidioides immitis RS]|uniref:Uncharacterized protein n=1 Tax=Coccidioides immitis (strain RS) TaxID=246410 RepID=A0A0D8JX46_COCIM|nr:uncharacterized protein CIMG_13717 [Coccidioides immitis RS]KJF61511.1 hypothetical protein CIMG_13717 [Coccidioides immitis RS]